MMGEMEEGCVEGPEGHFPVVQLPVPLGRIRCGLHLPIESGL